MNKEQVALLVFIVVSVTPIYCLLAKAMDWKTACVLLVFAVVAPFAIVNYDVLTIRKVKGPGFELELAKKEIDHAKEEALEEIAEQVKRHEETLREVGEFAESLKREIEAQKTKVLSLGETADDTLQRIKALNDAAREIALIQVRATYFILETKNEFGTSRVAKAQQEALDDLNRLLVGLIPDETKRSEWIKKLKETLPPRR